MTPENQINKSEAPAETNSRTGVRIDRTYSVCLLLVAVAAIAWIIRPFPDQLASNNTSLMLLSGPQKVNIQVASNRINGAIIKPGEEFSFNGRVGDRVESEGFLCAPTYIGAGTGETEGGGICLVSSLLYKTALEAGLAVTERKSHSRPIRSIKPGYDATVVYGRYDLRFKNTTSEPIEIASYATSSSISISIHGRREGDPITLVREPRASSPRQLTVAVFARRGAETTLVSVDRYRTN